MNRLRTQQELANKHSSLGGLVLAFIENCGSSRFKVLIPRMSGGNLGLPALKFEETAVQRG